MSTDTTDEENGLTRVECPELPRGWEWWSGETSRSYYTMWFGTEYRQGGDLVHDGCVGGYDGEIFWDAGGYDDTHAVVFYPVEGVRDDGDPRVSEYAEIHREYDSKQEAVNAVPELIRKLKARHG
ncbi:hypothetical protein PN419_00465 [Halorubrum ezzemoulense]|uniref:hypothetical protein n=1 Tax=Halorubrum ezzemoulense TaxID=337243 RepID=UPI0023307CBA|nr:hypothetical protein [Halorubrum ezzemoulense]MDB9247480.1 hypothetical protein [Halorubrum ezzemoulense]MDB9258611.1 hypothetical protein [Halorubrum ezzemoulense]MDB9264530.1 hypothetical protein [Halorubrum ezzemoulense]MDB9268972.1 hypothetical protein [Halorubrum ezzemoulense]MDB9271498.1 hypothetical protein [Halorubrum ezzemoulense]